MSVNGIPSHLTGLLSVQDARAERAAQERGQRAVQQPISQQPLPTRDVLASSQPQPTLPAEPPVGTDPELWSVLSSEERVFFAKVGAMGPLTYGRVSTEMRAESSIPRGGRLDVRG
jgi:hypothetical protein